MEYLFVYGTLMRNPEGKMAALLVQNAEFHSRGYFFGKLFLAGYYPGAVLGEDQDAKVYGEIYRITAPDLLSILDEYEEIGEPFPKPSEYIRQRITVYTMANEAIQTWVYLYNLPTDQLPPIPSGNFLNFYE